MAGKLNVPFLTQIKATGLPEPTHHKNHSNGELKFHPSRRWRFDYAWIDHKIAIEVEGGAWTRGRHVRPIGFRNDLEKYGEAWALGWDVLRVSPEMLVNGTALRWLRKRMER